MKKICIAGAVLLLGFVTSANAALVFVDVNGNTVAGPALLDGSMEAIYFSETIDGFGNGQYSVTNNTVDYGLISFGISNNDTFASIGSFGRTFGCFASWCYASSELNAFNWDTQAIDYNGTTGAGLFGAISNVLDAGDNMLNFYEAADGDLRSGDSWDQFLYGPGILASQLFVVLQGTSGPIYASGGQPVNAVPLPAAVWLFGSGLLGLAGLARRKKA